MFPTLAVPFATAISKILQFTIGFENCDFEQKILFLSSFDKTKSL